MKKCKLGAVNSYYQYQQSKIRKRQYRILGLVGIILAWGVIREGKVKAHLEALFSMGDYQNKTIAESMYLIQPSIDYLTYIAPETAKGIYIPSNKINSYKDYIKMAKEAGINSFVIDVKDDTGYLTFESDNPNLSEFGMVLSHPPIENMREIIDALCEANIYPIARIVAFKDSVAVKYKPERAVKSLDGTTYVTKSQDTWLDPYCKENWEYLLEVSKEAIKMGFKEIQFDYVRFHESMNESRVILDDNVSKSQIITEFTKYMCENLHKEGVKVSADVFGAVVLSDIDAEIVGQNFSEMSQYLDYICPMVYPSHYAEGTFGIEYPHLEPYQLIYKTMRLGVSRIQGEAKENQAEIRPWLQNFTMKSAEPYLKYGPEEIKAQIEGANDAGVEEWLLWNAAGTYYMTESY